MSLSSVTPFKACAAAIARAVLGEPNRQYSTRSQMRFGSRGSLSVEIAGEKAGTWFDHEANIGGGMLDLVQRERHLDKAEALQFCQNVGVSLNKSEARASISRRIVATYDYRDEKGALLYQVLRYEPKDFRQRRADGAWSLGDVRRVLYRLPEIITKKDELVFVVEGEKDVDALFNIGLLATCNAGGAAKSGQKSKWRNDYTHSLKGRDVVVLPDNDEAGEAHATSIAKALSEVSSSVKIVRLPGLPAKGDVSDWLRAGGTKDGLLDLVSNTQKVAMVAAHEGEVIEVGSEGLLTEDAVATEFANRYAGRLKFCHSVGKWYGWGGTHWKQDKKHRAYTFARRIAGEISATADLKARVAAGKASFSGGVEKFAQRDEVFAVTSEEWDRDPFLLATPGGTIELRTGKMRPATPADMITKRTAIAPACDDCPLWKRFLSEATNGDADLIEFLQRWCGYCLAGDTREHALIFCYGPGGNGKSVFLNTVAKIMGDYAANAAMDTFTAGHGDKHPTDLAMLRGARLVTASETEEGRAWAEARIKQMTGGDPITARFMRQDFFTFLPEFKLTIVGNHKPVLKNVDEAARRRFNIVPFIHKPKNPDRELEQKLITEWPAILQWMIDGCLKWQENGLPRPKVVREATDEYFEAQDSFGQWLAERCVLDPCRSSKPSDLLKDFQEWCHQNGEPEADNKRLRGMLERTEGLKYVRKRIGNGNPVQLVQGITLLPKRHGDQG
ncbi:phage/plasmid primase P4 [Acetobacter aceti NRIC 0242]|uniref:SF3 helicase domain-containing protein n=1 Tax=Acetobacter aceti NBRC 14818 TaxID=887700 RepID=A0AB33IP94_ACEAC|nr:phage/plasmid primase, P4 family [Acetobacter aceti]TCS32061.1 P4 family phage/plasmid primase-like protein [Acetobacter aceti NBRC 14818]BCK77367.1 hypothetical protein EMQ_2973 [Acetobacter aceti NBRC 14818]GAN58334.1 phage/plasmid primase P4 [Acetobacter aceti NBRC 14818]GBO81719.1 phage/plasmid primase P4 [Acetobacter aceti NRIC 0242]